MSDVKLFCYFFNFFVEVGGKCRLRCRLCWSFTAEMWVER